MDSLFFYYSYSLLRKASVLSKVCMYSTTSYGVNEEADRQTEGRTHKGARRLWELLPCGRLHEKEKRKRGKRLELVELPRELARCLGDWLAGGDASSSSQSDGGFMARNLSR